MIAFPIAALVLLIVVSALLARPLWKRRDAPASANESPALRILREQRVELDAELANNSINAAQHATRLAELQRRALEEGEALAPVASTQSRRLWAIALVVLLPLCAVATYLVLGNLDALNPDKRVAASADITPAQIDAMVEKLAARVKANPDNVDDVKMLARSYMVLGRFKDASALLEQVAGKAPDAQIYADWADAVASANDRQLTGRPEQLIAKALQLDPQNIKALALSGTVAFERKDYKLAVREWEKIAARVPADSEFGQSVQTMLNEARNRAGMPAPKTAKSAATTPALTIRGQVTISDRLKKEVSPEDAIFVFARPAEGGPPVGGMRFKASELPIKFDFTQAMMMGNPLTGQKLIIGARVSKAGNAMPQPGDLQGFSKPVALDAQSVKIEISEIVGGK